MDPKHSTKRDCPVDPLIGEGIRGQNKFVRQISGLKRDLFLKRFSKKVTWL